MRFLIDECLSLELTRLARDRGHGESQHVVWLGLAGAKDWELKPVILAGDWTFVTRNSVDFRGPAAAPGRRGQYAGVELHAGLVCLNGGPGMDLDLQIDLFRAVLDDIEASGDPVNQVIEICSDGSDHIEIVRYRLPSES